MNNNHVSTSAQLGEQANSYRENFNVESFELMQPPDFEAIGSFVEIPGEIKGTPLKHTPTLATRSTHSTDVQCNQSRALPDAHKFPDIEKCIPKWKQNFPWVCWCSEDNTLYCLHCRELLRKCFPDEIQKSNVILVSVDKIFSVAKTLRAHHVSQSHTMAIYLYSHSTLISFISLVNNHYKDMKKEEEVIETVRGMFNYSELNKDSFVRMIIDIGKFIEKTLLKNLKKSKYFSVVADQCRGIIILRWVDGSGKIEEHVFWSYLSEWNLTPMQYLQQFDLNLSNMTLYIANSICQQCQRCQKLSVKPASLPPRPPSIHSFVGLLWNLDLLRPLMSLVNTVYKLLKIYPYKFSKLFDSSDQHTLFNFSLKPLSFIKIMDNFDQIKHIATEIYESRSYVEALGLAMVELKSDDKHKKMLFYLQEIIDVVKEASLVHKITDQQIVKLNQALGSLKMRSHEVNFVTYGSHCIDDESRQFNQDKVRDFLLFVEMFIDENQRSIYYSGRDRIHDFINICNLGSVLDASKENINETKLFNAFNTIFDVYMQVLKHSHASDKIRIFKCIKNFYTYLIQSNQSVKNCMDILKLFHGDQSLQRRFPDALEIFTFCATMPFQPCQVARSLFVSFVNEQRIESSVWAKMKDNIKPWLLYMQHELSFIPPNDILIWWFESIE